MEEDSPSVIDFALPEGERQKTIRIQTALDCLTRFIEAFEADLELFGHALENKAIEMRWTPIACRDAAMNLWAFYDALIYLKRTLPKCPSLRTAEKEKAVSAAQAAFEITFPDAHDMRDVAGHPVGHMAGKGQGKGHDINGIMIQNSWTTDRKVMNTFEGREISFELSGDTVSALRSIRKIVFDAFRSP